MRFETLPSWLTWIEHLHPRTIDLTLDRPRAVLERMGLTRPAHRVITVAGTNGKGSSVAMLDAILRAAGYRVGTYTSPHLYRHNERIRVQGEPVSDAALCAAFDAVDQARGDISLTYFEFGTLAAFERFAREQVDVAVLEVGLGGRLDAVNLLDPDAALITTVDLDHMAWLGPDRESIGREKAGILRAGRPAVCADPQPPCSVVEHARALGAPLYCLGQEFGFEVEGDLWHFWFADDGGRRRRRDLPRPALRAQAQFANAAGVLALLDRLAALLPLDPRAVPAGLREVRLGGRLEVIPGPVDEVRDVAHNPQAARELALNLGHMAVGGRTLAVFAALADKDLVGLAAPLVPLVAAWFVAGLSGERGCDAGPVAAAVRQAGATAVSAHAGVREAHAAALAEARPGDRVVVFGSFYTLAELAPPPV